MMDAQSRFLRRRCCCCCCCCQFILTPTPLPLLPAPAQEAESSEKSQPPMAATCRAIVKEVVGHGVEEEDRKRTWMADAGGCGQPTVCLPTAKRNG